MLRQTPAGLALVFSTAVLNQSVTIGTAITPSTSSADPSYTALATSGNISADCHFLELEIHGGFVTATAKLHMLTIGIDPDGGTSYTDIISNLIVSSATAAAQGSMSGRAFHFPLYVKSGSSVAVKIRGSDGSATTVYVVARFFGYNQTPENANSSQYSATFGATTASTTGVSFTPGSGAKGSWASVGSTTVAPLNWFQVGAHVNNTAISSRHNWIDVAYGDGTNMVLVIADAFHTTGSGEDCSHHRHGGWVNPVPVGSQLYVRGASNTGPSSGWEAVIVGMMGGAT